MSRSNVSVSVKTERDAEKLKSQLNKIGIASAISTASNFTEWFLEFDLNDKPLVTGIAARLGIEYVCIQEDTGASNAITKAAPICNLETDKGEKWYYSADGSVKKGPCRKCDLETLLQKGALSPDTLVWSKILPGWMPAVKVSALKWDRGDAPPDLPKSLRRAHHILDQETPDLPSVGLARPEKPVVVHYHVSNASDEDLGATNTKSRRQELRVEHFDRSSFGRSMKVMGFGLIVLALMGFAFSFFLSSSGSRRDSSTVAQISSIFLILGLLMSVFGAIYVYIYRRDK